MSFFDLAPKKRIEEPERPRWLGPPEDEIGVVLVVERALAQTDRALVSVRSVTAYREGFSVAIAAFRHAALDDDEFDVWDDLMFWGVEGEDRIPDEFLRFGIEFADGRKATNLDGFRETKRGESPKSPVLIGGPGGGGGRRTNLDYWVWPLPPPGPLAFVCEWPSEGIPVSRGEIEGALVREAAGRAASVWE